MGRSHNVSKRGFYLSDEVSRGCTIGVIHLNPHGLFLLEEILYCDFCVPVGVEIVLLLFGLPNELQLPVKTGLQEYFQKRVGFGKHVGVFQVPSAETEFNFKGVRVVLRGLHFIKKTLKNI